MDRNYCFRRKLHFYAACDAALAASLSIMVLFHSAISFNHKKKSNYFSFITDKVMVTKKTVYIIKKLDVRFQLPKVQFFSIFFSLSRASNVFKLTKFYFYISQPNAFYLCFHISSIHRFAGIDTKERHTNSPWSNVKLFFYFVLLQYLQSINYSKDDP